MEAIRCESLGKSYGKVVALAGLDLTVEDGMVFGFLGPNGAGKTTTVKLLTGLGQPTRGHVWVADQPVDAHSLSFRARIGYLPEDPAFYGWMTGLDFLTHIGQLFGLDRKAARRRGEELMNLVGLQEAQHRRVAGYSRGMRQRLGLAQALINRPRVLFLDEPCSALDPVGRRDVLALLRRLRGTTTVFMSTHILADVERICDRVAVIDRGRLVTSASIDDLRARYTRPVFELRFQEPSERLERTIAALPWVRSFERVGDETIRISASDAEAARGHLPGIAANSGLTLLRYEVISPTLEDIFVSLVTGDQDEGSIQ